MNRFRSVWNSLFAQPVLARDLSLFRLVYCGSLAAVHATQIPRLGHLYDSFHSVYFPIPSFEWLGLDKLPFAIAQCCNVALLVALVLAACGLLVRVALLAAVVTFFLYYGTILGFEKPWPNSVSPYTFHYNNLVCFTLLILAVAPKSTWHAEPRIPRWPLRLVELSMALAYFGSGYAKLRASGLLWADGHTLQGHLLLLHLQEDAAFGLWIAQHYWVCVILGVATLAFELTFIVVPFLPRDSRVRWMYVCGGVIFHGAIAVAMRITHFLPYMGLSYLVFVHWSRASIVWGRGGASAAEVPDASRPVGVGPWAGAFICGLVSVLVLCIVWRVEFWPFSDYGVFVGRSHYSRVCAGRLQGVTASGERNWINPREVGPGFKGWYDGTNFRRFLDSHARRPARDEKDRTVELLTAYYGHLPERTRAKYQGLAYVQRCIVRRPDGSLASEDRILATSRATSP